MSLFAQFYLPLQQLVITFFPNFLYLFFLPSPLIISVLRILFFIYYWNQLFSRYQLTPRNSYFMASFDIKSLFGNITLEETVSIATENYFNITNPSRNFTPKLFKDLLTSVKDIIFLFNGKVFSQIDGVGMGNPLWSTFANLFLCHHETNWLDKN